MSQFPPSIQSVYIGQDAFSEAKINQITNLLKKSIKNKGLDYLQIKEIFLVNSPIKIKNQSLIKLKKILKLSNPLNLTEARYNQQDLFLMPKFNSPSLWSVHMTKLLEDCQISDVSQIERILWVRFNIQKAYLAQEIQYIFDILHTEIFKSYETDFDRVLSRFALQMGDSNSNAQNIETQTDQANQNSRHTRLMTQKILKAKWESEDLNLNHNLISFENTLNQIRTASTELSHTDAAIFKLNNLKHLNNTNQYYGLQSFQTPINPYSMGCMAIDIGYGVTPLGCVTGYYFNSELFQSGLDISNSSVRDILLKLPKRRAKLLGEMGCANISGFVRMGQYETPSMEVQQYALLEDIETGQSASLSQGHLSEKPKASQNKYFILPNIQHRRRVQTVISRCHLMGKLNPILAIEYNAEGDLMCIVSPIRYGVFVRVLEREQCKYLILNNLTDAIDWCKNKNNNNQLTWPVKLNNSKLDLNNLNNLNNINQLENNILKILAHPSVADKRYLIHHFDRSVGGRVVRDQLVGPWQIPVSDVAVMRNDFETQAGVAIAVGERGSNVFKEDIESGLKLVFAEVLTNLFAADIVSLESIKLTLYWKMSCPPRDANINLIINGFIQALKAEFGIEVCVLNPMAEEGKVEKNICSVSLHAIAPVNLVRNTLTPELQCHVGETELIYINLTSELGLSGSILEEVLDQKFQNNLPKVNMRALYFLLNSLKQLRSDNKILAYHDCSDGGIIASVLEMAFAARCGLDIDVAVEEGEENFNLFLFSEGPGVIIQIHSEDHDEVLNLLTQLPLPQSSVQSIGSLNNLDQINLSINGECVLNNNLKFFQKAWMKPSYQMSYLSKPAEIAKSEWLDALDFDSRGLYARVNWSGEINFIPANPGNPGNPVNPVKKRVGILRSSCSTGDEELEAVFNLAGFECIDLRLNLLRQGVQDFDQIDILAIGSGFSYGDVLGAGWGFAQAILNHPCLFKLFKNYFEDETKQTIGLGNGAQALCYLKNIIPGSEYWPVFEQNSSECFESRVSMVKILSEHCPVFQNLTGAHLPIITATEYGKAVFKDNTDYLNLLNNGQILLSFTDFDGKLSEAYPENPYGSLKGVCGISNKTHNIIALMVQPERCFLTDQLSWHPSEWGKYSPWMQFFLNMGL